ncbi:MAG: phage major tail tube protein [Methyloprofundus sp.]|nr:phage major tail tube protein [Methyloprofundus sp.]
MAVTTSDILKNLTLFVDGYGYAGKVEEVTLPKLTMKTEEFRGGGMDAPIEIEMGLEKMEASFTLVSFSAEILKLWGLAPGNDKPLTIKGSLLDEDGTEKPVAINLRGKLKELDAGTWKPGDMAKLKASVAVTYYKLTHNNVVLHEIDPVNMVRIIDGVDQLAQTRANLGL